MIRMVIITIKFFYIRFINRNKFMIFFSSLIFTILNTNKLIFTTLNTTELIEII